MLEVLVIEVVEEMMTIGIDVGTIDIQIEEVDQETQSNVYLVCDIYIDIISKVWSSFTY